MSGVPRTASRHDVQRLRENDGAVLVEVLPRPEYDWAHLPDAVHISLKRWDVTRVRAQLDVSGPVIVYCHDST
jgi:rhodanese-related sulfurtransferase